jgi:tRNA(fMet)-specific endonuclease VapC
MNVQYYLLDTSAVVEILRNPQGMVARRLMENGGVSYCAITDITLYELYAGAYASKHVDKNVAAIDRLTDWIQVIPSSQAYKEAARQKISLRASGQVTEVIDILIGCTAIVSKRILVSSNFKHLGRLQGIQITDWSV